MTNKKKILFISAFFPNLKEPNIATYNRQQLDSLSDVYDIDAIVPIPWHKKLKNIVNKASRKLRTINVYYPTYYYPPLFFRQTYGYFYYFSIFPVLKYLVSKNQYDFVFSSWLYPDSWAASLVARRLDLPLFVSVLGSDVNRLKPGDKFIKRSLEVGKHASKIICVSNALKDRLAALGFDRSKLIYLQNGVNKNIFHPVEQSLARAGWGYDKDEKIILFVGNLKKEKGLLELVEAFKLLLNNLDHKRNLLLIVGSGSFAYHLRKRVSELGISANVSFMGEKSPKEISKLMAACDVFCLPSYSEGQPNVVIEALSCRTKVVSTNVGGIPELDTGKNNIELVEPRNVKELERALSVMLMKDHDVLQWQVFNSWRDNAMELSNIFNDSVVKRRGKKCKN